MQFGTLTDYFNGVWAEKGVAGGDHVPGYSTLHDLLPLTTSRTRLLTRLCTLGMCCAITDSLPLMVISLAMRTEKTIIGQVGWCGLFDHWCPCWSAFAHCEKRAQKGIPAASFLLCAVGYFTSRPFYKFLDRVLESTLRAAEIMFSLTVSPTRLAFKKQHYSSLVSARRALSLFQHHDGKSGYGSTLNGSSSCTDGGH
jgi:hypothetical protein